MEVSPPTPVPPYGRLAVSSEMVFVDLPHVERVRRTDELGWTGTVGLETWASGGPEVALQRFRDAFSVPSSPLAPRSEESA